MYTQISAFLHTVGFRATYIGYRYLACAIGLALADETYLRSLTTRLYPEIARRFQTSASSVERSLRTLLEVFWVRGNIALLENALGYPLRDKPYPGELIDILASCLRFRG